MKDVDFKYLSAKTSTQISSKKNKITKIQELRFYYLLVTFVYPLLAITRNERKIFHIIEILLNEMRKSLTVIASDKSSCKKI